MTSISFDSINRVKYQLCQSQKGQYHLCGDELCARRMETYRKKQTERQKKVCYDFRRFRDSAVQNNSLNDSTEGPRLTRFLGLGKNCVT